MSRTANQSSKADRVRTGAPIHQPRPAPRRQGTRAAIVAAAKREG